MNLEKFIINTISAGLLLLVLFVVIDGYNVEQARLAYHATFLTDVESIDNSTYIHMNEVTE